MADIEDKKPLQMQKLLFQGVWIIDQRYLDDFADIKIVNILKKRDYY